MVRNWTEKGTRNTGHGAAALERQPLLEELGKRRTAPTTRTLVVIEHPDETEVGEVIEIVGLPGFERFIGLPRGEYGTGGKDRVVWLHCAISRSPSCRAISAGFRLKYTSHPEEEP